MILSAPSQMPGYWASMVLHPAAHGGRGMNGQSLRQVRRSRGSTSNRGFEGFLNVEKGAGVSAGASPGTGAGTNALTIHSP